MNMDESEHDKAMALDAAAEGKVSAGDLKGAAESYGSSLHLWRKLVRLSPDNAQLQRNFAVTYFKLGEVREALDNRSGALASYRSGLAIAERIATTLLTGDAEQELLAIWYERVAVLQAEHGNRSDALEAYRSSVSIMERLAAAFPANVNYRRYLLRDYTQIASILHAGGDLEGALDNLTSAMQETVVHFEALRLEISVSQFVLGNIYLAKGDGERAKHVYGIALALSEELIGTASMTDRQAGDRSLLLERMGDASVLMGDNRDAAERFRASLAIVDGLAARHPDLHNDQMLLREKLSRASAG
jgi:tetratricopeptide (TPR) repeat protein